MKTKKKQIPSKSVKEDGCYKKGNVILRKSLPKIKKK